MGGGGGYTFPLVMRACLVEELKRILWNHEISVEIKIGAGEKKKTSDSESTQLNALIIVPLHFL